MNTKTNWLSLLKEKRDRRKNVGKHWLIKEFRKRRKRKG